jgi:hypothetical protein
LKQIPASIISGLVCLVQSKLNRWDWKYHHAPGRKGNVLKNGRWKTYSNMVLSVAVLTANVSLPA